MAEKSHLRGKTSAVETFTAHKTALTLNLCLLALEALVPKSLREPRLVGKLGREFGNKHSFASASFIFSLFRSVVALLTCSRLSLSH